MNSGKVLLGVLAGVAAGALIGVLFAPSKGSRTRKRILKKGEDYADGLKEKFEDVLAGVSKKIEKIKEDVNDFTEQAHTRSEEVKEELKTVKGWKAIKTGAMDDNAKLLESLMIKVTDYGKTSFELIKLKALDTTSGIISSLIPFSAAFVIIGSFMLFLNVGLAFWLGDILGKIYFGFFIVAGFYLVIGSVLYFLTKNWLKKLACNYFIKQVLK